MNELTRNAFVDVIHAYQIPDEQGKQQAITRLLESDQSKAIVEWLKLNPLAVDASPMLRDLKKRLVEAVPSAPAPAQSSFFHKAATQISGLYRSFASRLEGSRNYVEDAILSGRFSELSSDLAENPDELLSQADLIKLHLSLGSLSFEELAPILEKAADQLKEKAMPSSPYAPAAEPHERPSLFRVFQDEIYQSLMPFDDKIDRYIGVFEALFEQDKASLKPVSIDQKESAVKQFISLVPAHVLLDFIYAKDSHGNSALHNEKTLHQLLPVMLEKLPIDQLQEILKLNNPEGQTPLQFVNQQTLSSLSRQQCLRFAAITASFENLPEGFTEMLPSYAQIYLDMLKNTPDTRSAIRAVSNIEALSETEKRAAISTLIEKKKCALSTTGLSADQLIDLAPYLHFLDVRGLDVNVANKLIKNCPDLQTLYIDDGRMLDGVKELGQCQHFTSDKSKNLTHLPELPQCRIFSSVNCTDLTSIPELPQCQDFNSIGCLKLRKLPKELPQCKKFVSALCEELKQLPALPRCLTLYCNSCPNLKALPPKLQKCQRLYLSSCTSLKELPELPECQTLDISSCSNLRRLPAALPLCKEFSCAKCTALTEVPELPECASFQSDECVNLITISALPNCQSFSCERCTNLRAVPATLPLCQNLNCKNCPNLRGLPAELPLCRRLDYTNSPLISEMPAVPEEAWVRPLIDRPSAPISLSPAPRIKVNVEDFTNNPKNLLHQLGVALREARQFPKVRYYMNGERVEAFDAGGVGRDFISRLCINLFKSYKDSKDSENFLLKDDNAIPMMTSAEDEKEAYETLGLIFAMCIRRSVNFKTGPLLNENVYSYFLAPGEIGSDEWFLHNYIGFGIKSPEIIESFINPENPLPQIEQKDLYAIAYLIDHECEDPSYLTQEYIAENRAKIRDSIVISARENRTLKAAMVMASAMKKKMFPGEWNAFKAAGPKALKDSIEGVLSAKALLNQLEWKYSGLKSDPRYIRTTKYVTEWINRADEETLSKFVYAVTGLKTLSASKLVIDIYNRGPDVIPSAHTCFFQFVLSSEYRNQEEFDNKLNVFLENALAGPGFSFA